MNSIRYVFILIPALFAYADGDLQSLISNAFRQNPKVLAAEKEYSAKAAEVLPSYFPANPTAGYEYMTSGENKFSVGQMLDFPLKTFFKGGIKSREASIAKYKAVLAKAEVMRDIRIVYFEAAAVSRLAELEKNKKMELGLFRDLAESKYKVGRGEQAEYVRAKIDMLLAEKKIIAFSAEREMNIRTLTRLIGGTIPNVRFTLEGTRPDIDPSLVARATNSFAGILMKNAAAGIAEDESALATFEFLPDISLMGTYTTSGMGNSASVFIGLTVPLFLPFKEIPRASAAGDMKEAARNELVDAQNEVIADITSRMAAYRQSRETLALFSGSILHEARQALDASFKSYETDKITFLMLLQNIIMLYDYYAEEVMARRDMNISWAWLAFYSGDAGGETMKTNAQGTRGHDPLFFHFSAALVLIISFTTITACAPSNGGSAHAHTAHAKKKTMYHCPMHPNFTSDKQRPCPICGMDLVVIEEETQAPHSNTEPVAGYTTVAISPERQQLIGVKTAIVARQNLTKRIRAVGRVSNDPSLYNAQQEYITTLRHYNEMKSEVSPEVTDRSKSMVDSARFKLKLLGLSDSQIDAIGKRAEPDVSLITTSGQSSAWVYAEIFEYDLAYVRPGQTALVTIPASRRELIGSVQSIDPILNTETRSARARIYIGSTLGLLRSEAYVNVSIAVPVGTVLAVPEDAVLDTGTRMIIFIDKGNGHFEPREVNLGEKVDTYFVIRSGIKEGERVVTSANFLIDSESQLKAALKHMGSGK